MSFWWSPKTSPKKDALESSSSFSSFEQLTKDAWEVADESINCIQLSQGSNIWDKSINESIFYEESNDDNNYNSDNKNIDINLSSNDDKLFKYQPLLLGRSNSISIEDVNLQHKNFKLSSSNNKDLTNNSNYLDLLDKTNIDNYAPQLRLPISDVHKMAEEIVQFHKLSLCTKTNKNQIINSNFNFEYKQKKNTFLENYDKSIVNNNGQLNKKIPKSKIFSNRGVGRILGPGIGIRKKDLYSNKWSKCVEEEESKIIKFSKLLDASDLDIDCLRKLSWSGIPMQSRGEVWKILCGYLPLNPERREAVINRKRMEYLNCVDQYFGMRQADGNKEVYHQIHIDIPRMQVLMKVFQQIKVQEMFERILYIWAIRHPASSYVQGINDLLVPFFVVFLSKHIDKEEDLECFEIDRLNASTLNEIEADSYWCLSRLLDGIQDNYTFAQPGIQRQINLLKELTARLNNVLHEYLMRHQIEYLQFSFRWFNNLLMREIPLHCAIRLWDAFLSEVNGFTQLHLFVCSALLSRFSDEILKEDDFQGIMLFLGRLPTEHWSSSDIALLLADAHRLRYIFADTPNHYRDI